jgi:Na+/proline symporter
MIGIFLLSDGIAELKVEDILYIISERYLSEGLKGALIVAVISMATSTADSYINTAAVSLSYDLLRVTGIRQNHFSEMFITRLMAIVMGLAGLYFSIYSTNMLDIILSTYSFYAPVVSVPLLLTLFGLRMSSMTVLIGMIVGITTVLSIKLFTDFESLIPGLLANLVTILFIKWLNKSIIAD